MSKIAHIARGPFAIRHNSFLRFCAGLLIALAWLALSAVPAQATTYALGTTALLEGPAAGIDSIVLAVTPATGTWTATTNAAWLHLSHANQSGRGSTNVVFTYDANPGATRSGTLTIDGQMLTVTQAGSTYVAAGVVTTLASPLDFAPQGVAVDGAGDVYIAEAYDPVGYFYSGLFKWTAASNTVTALTTRGILSFASGVATDGAGNVYISDWGEEAIREWKPADTNSLYEVVDSAQISYPTGVAVDYAGNVYIADGGDSALQEWKVANNTVTTLASGMYGLESVTVDRAGNVYIAAGTIYKWTPANNSVTTLVSGVVGGEAVAVDGAGNVYFAAGSAIYEWTAANSTVTTLESSNSITPLYYPQGVAVDGAGNVYIADTGNSDMEIYVAYTNAIKELPHAFVDPTPRFESMAAGNDALPVVLPTTENLLAPFAPTSDQPWLTISGAAKGVVSFSFTTNTGPSRTAHITLLGQSIPITQAVIGTPPTLTDVQMLGNGVVQFAFTNNPGATFTVLSTTDLSMPLSNWTVVGTASNAVSNVFLFTTQPTIRNASMAYAPPKFQLRLCPRNLALLNGGRIGSLKTKISK